MTLRRVKILQLQNYYNVSASDLAEQIIQALPAEDYDVTTAFLNGHPGPDEPASRAERSVYFNLGESAFRGLRLRLISRLYRHCRTERYDAVIAHRFKPVNAMLLINRLLPFRACIGVAHGFGEYDRPSRRWLTRALMAPHWRTVGVSRAVCTYLIDSHAGFTQENTRQINNAIDIRRAESIQHHRSRARELLGLPKDAFILGTIGRLVPVKGHIHLLNAFATIKDESPGAVVGIIGEGRSRSDLEKQIAARGLDRRVHLLGARNDALQFVKAFDVFVMPSMSEGLPLALLEGMTARIPVIGSDIPSLLPILEDCGGHIFAAGQYTSLARCLSEVIELSPEQRREEGERAYRYLCHAHAIEDFRRKYRELLEELLSLSDRH